MIESARHALSAGWKRIQLGDVGEIVSGVTLGRKTNGAATRRIPYLRVANVKDGRLDLSDLNAIEVTNAEIEKLRLKWGDLLLTEGGDRDKLGRGTFWEERIPECIHQNHIFRVRFDLNLCWPPFVSAQIGSPYGKAYFISHTKQTTGIATINQRVLAGFPLMLPSLPKQKRITAVLDEQMAAVERARAAAQARLEAAKNIRHAYFRRGFRNITPLAAGPDRDTAPPGWKWRLLTTLARLESGHTPSRYHPEWWRGTIPWIALPDIRELDGKVAYETSEYTNEAGIANSSARVLPAGTVVMSRTASLGFVTIMGRGMATSQDFVNWVCGPDLDPHFLALLMQASRRYVRSLSSGAVHQTVYVSTVKAFEVCVPPLPQQRRITRSLSEQLEGAEKVRLALEEEFASVNALPAAIRRRAFSGEL